MTQHEKQTYRSRGGNSWAPAPFKQKCPNTNMLRKLCMFHKQGWKKSNYVLVQVQTLELIVLWSEKHRLSHFKCKEISVHSSAPKKEPQLFSLILLQVIKWYYTAHFLTIEDTEKTQIPDISTLNTWNTHISNPFIFNMFCCFRVYWRSVVTYKCKRRH